MLSIIYKILGVIFFLIAAMFFGVAIYELISPDTLNADIMFFISCGISISCIGLLFFPVLSERTALNRELKKNLK